MKYAEININQIIVSKKHFKDKCRNGDIVALARSIKKVGIIQPICVKPLIYGGYEIVSGNRRYCASKLAGIKHIPCLITEKGDSAPIIALSNDIFGEGNAFAVADRLKACLIKSGRGIEGISEESGIEVSTLLEYLAPVCLTELERRIALDNKLSGDIIRKISALPSKEERLEALTGYIKAGEYNKRNTVIRRTANAHARRRTAIKGLGFFENTLKRSLELLEGAGIHTERHTEERGNEIEYRIKVSNKV